MTAQQMKVFASRVAREYKECITFGNADSGERILLAQAIMAEITAMIVVADELQKISPSMRDLRKTVALAVLAAMHEGARDQLNNQL